MALFSVKVTQADGMLVIDNVRAKSSCDAVAAVASIFKPPVRVSIIRDEAIEYARRECVAAEDIDDRADSQDMG